MCNAAQSHPSFDEPLTVLGMFFRRKQAREAHLTSRGSSTERTRSLYRHCANGTFASTGRPHGTFINPSATALTPQNERAGSGRADSPFPPPISNFWTHKVYGLGNNNYSNYWGRSPTNVPFTGTTIQEEEGERRNSYDFMFQPTTTQSSSPAGTPGIFHTKSSREESLQG